MTAKRDLAVIAIKFTHQKAQNRGFSGTGSANDSNHLARFYLKFDILQVDAAIFLIRILKFLDVKCKLAFNIGMFFKFWLNPVILFSKKQHDSIVAGGAAFKNIEQTSDSKHRPNQFR